MIIICSWVTTSSLTMFSCEDLFIPSNDHTGSSGWVDQPPYRGTYDIIFSCLLVVITCTWSVLHLNLPAPDEPYIQTWLRKGRWAFLAIILPEVVTLFAGCQWSSARLSIESMQALGVKEWSAVHGFYADAGGFILHTPDMPPFPINTTALHYLIERKYLDHPTIKKEDILDRSKSDLFARAIGIIQTSWIIVQIAARLNQSLDVSPLELVTVAFSICTIASFYFWMEKPLDIERHSHLTTPIPISKILRDAGDAASAPYIDTPMDFVGGCGVLQGAGHWGRKRYFKTFGGLKARPMQRIPDDYTPPPSSFRLAFIQWALSMIHCGMHVASWNFRFPTTIETWLWRTASLTMLGILLVTGLVEVLSVKPGVNFTISLAGIWEKTSTSNSSFRRWAMDIPAITCSILYAAARIALLAEAAISLRSMPSSVYLTVRWTNYFPHF